MCVVMWGKRAPAPIFGLYTCITVGMTVAPLIAAPFLSKPLSPHNTTESSCEPADNSTDSPFLNYIMSAYQLQHRAPNMTETHMQIPYAITGISSAVIGFLFLGFYLFTTGVQSSRGPSKRKLRDMINPGSCANGSKWFGAYCSISLLVCYVFSNGRDRGFGMFVFTVANKGMNVNKNTAALIMFSYNATGAIARALCALLSLFIPIQIITLILIVGAVMVQIVMIFYALNSVTYFWVLCCAMSIFIGPVYPSMLGWVDRYIEMNGVIMAMIQVGLGTGGLSGMFLTNYVFQRFHAQAVMYLALLYGTGLATVFIPLQIIAHLRGTRDQQGDYQRLTEPSCDVDTDENGIHSNANYSVNSQLETNAIDRGQNRNA